MFEQHFLGILFSVSGTHEVGSSGGGWGGGGVGVLKVKDAIGVARAVMDYTDHTLIVGNWVNGFYTNH